MHGLESWKLTGQHHTTFKGGVEQFHNYLQLNNSKLIFFIRCRWDPVSVEKDHEEG